MKKILLAIAAGAMLMPMLTACDNDNKNPGDFTVKSELSVSDLTSLQTGKVFPVKIYRDVDTVYQHEYTRTDTVTGRTDTLYYSSKFTARFYEAETIFLDSDADTLRIAIKSNAKWNAPTPVPTSGSQWLYIESGNSGGGDSEIVLRVGRNRNNTRVGISNLEIFTSDSTVMYRLPIRQLGERDAQ